MKSIKNILNLIFLFFVFSFIFLSCNSDEVPKESDVDDYTLRNYKWQGWIKQASCYSKKGDIIDYIDCPEVSKIAENYLLSLKRDYNAVLNFNTDGSGYFVVTIAQNWPIGWATLGPKEWATVGKIIPDTYPLGDYKFDFPNYTRDKSSVYYKNYPRPLIKFNVPANFGSTNRISVFDALNLKKIKPYDNQINLYPEIPITLEQTYYYLDGVMTIAITNQDKVLTPDPDTNGTTLAETDLFFNYSMHLIRNSK